MKQRCRELALIRQGTAVYHAVAYHEHAPPRIALDYVFIHSHRKIVVVDGVAEASASLVWLEDVVDVGSPFAKRRIAQPKLESRIEFRRDNRSNGDKENDDDLFHLRNLLTTHSIIATALIMHTCPVFFHHQNGMRYRPQDGPLAENSPFASRDR